MVVNNNIPGKPKILSQNKIAKAIFTPPNVDRIQTMKLSHNCQVFEPNQSLYANRLKILFQIASKYDKSFLKVQRTNSDAVTIKLDKSITNTFKDRTDIQKFVQKLSDEIFKETKLQAKFGVAPTSLLCKVLLKKRIDNNSKIQILENNQQQISEYLNSLTLKQLLQPQEIKQLRKLNIQSVQDVLKYGYKIKDQFSRIKHLYRALGLSAPQKSMQQTFYSTYHEMSNKIKIIQKTEELMSHLYYKMKNVDIKTTKITIKINLKNGPEFKKIIKIDSNNSQQFILNKIYSRLEQELFIKAQGLSICLKCQCQSEVMLEHPPIDSHSLQTLWRRTENISTENIHQKQKQQTQKIEKQKQPINSQKQKQQAVGVEKQTKNIQKQSSNQKQL